jgi:hypothetical protein
MPKPRLRNITKKQLHALEDALYDIHRAVIRATYETDDPQLWSMHGPQLITLSCISAGTVSPCVMECLNWIRCPMMRTKKTAIEYIKI